MQHSDISADASTLYRLKHQEWQQFAGAHRFRGILESVGVTARSLYWCPNDLKEAEKEMCGNL